jgi:Domain of unknown function (DUF4338)
MESDLVVQGRHVGPEELNWLSGWIEGHPQWSRKRLARELCEHWGWRDERGRLKDFAARSLLLKLEAQGHLRLPPLHVQKRRAPRAVPRLSLWQQPPTWEGRLSQIRPVKLEVISAGSAAAVRWAFYLDEYHYLKLRVVGENLGYLAVDAHGRDVAAVLFGAPAWRCAPRDEFLEWGDTQRREQLHRLANNTRFLILPWVRVPHLASHVLGAVARRIGADWQSKYGHGLDWLETFVEHERFAGRCYRAANWQWVGRTAGRSRQDRDHTQRVPVKDVYLYRLGGRGS